jgi:hypothetical protein
MVTVAEPAPPFCKRTLAPSKTHQIGVAVVVVVKMVVHVPLIFN